METQAFHTEDDNRVFIPETSYIYRVQHRIMEGDCQCDHGPFLVTVLAFYMDKYPVTNEQYKQFLDESGYYPEDSHNFIKHWQESGIPQGKENHPVIWVSQEDARAYANWKGGRLPKETEWQLAAGGNQKLKWPWGNQFNADKCHSSGFDTMPVNAFSSKSSPYGCVDLSGNAWEWMDDTVNDEQHKFTFLRGGSYYKAPHTWHAEGGPHPTDYHLKFQLLNEGLNRCETVGFRCVYEVRR